MSDTDNKGLAYLDSARRLIGATKGLDDHDSVFIRKMADRFMARGLEMIVKGRRRKGPKPVEPQAVAAEPTPAPAPAPQPASQPEPSPQSPFAPQQRPFGGGK